MGVKQLYNPNKWQRYAVIKIVTYNIQFGCGRDGKVNLDRIVEVVHDADVIALQEVDRYWPRSGDMDQVKRIVEKFPGFDPSRLGARCA